MLIAALRATALRLPRIAPGFTLPKLALPKMEWRHWSASIVLVAVFALNIFAGMSILGLGTPAERAVAKVSRSTLPAELRNQAPPAPEPLKFREIAPEDAVSINAAVPISTLPNPAARPFKLSVSTEADRIRAIECLTSAVYYEAAIEGAEGQRAVAQVVLNRVRHPAYPKSVCGVVFQGHERSTGCQFTFTCDGSLARTPHPGLWQQARRIAEAAIAGYVHKPVGWATHYHTNWVVPYWSSSLVKAAIVGTHIFYRWTGGWGTAPAFRTRYAGAEPTISKMSHLTAVKPTEEELKEALAAEAALMGADGKPLPPQLAELLQRPVIRRFEPAKAEAVATVLAEQSKAAGTAVSPSYRWALTGDAPASADAFGKKPEATTKPEPKKAEPAAVAKAEAPKELEGVRKKAYGPSLQ